MIRVQKFPGPHANFSAKIKQLLPPELKFLAGFDDLKDARIFVAQKMGTSALLGSPSLPVEWSHGRHGGPGNLLEISSRLAEVGGIWVKPELVPQNGNLAAIIDRPGNFNFAIDEERTAFYRWGPLSWGYQNHSVTRTPDYLVFPGPSGKVGFVASKVEIGKVPEGEGSWLPEDLDDLATQSAYAGNFFFSQLRKNLPEKSALVREVRGRRFTVFVDLEISAVPISRKLVADGFDWVGQCSESTLVLTPPIIGTGIEETLNFQHELLLALKTR